MSSTSPNPPSHNEKRTPAEVQEAVRKQVEKDLLAFLDADVHCSGYIVAWISRRLELEGLLALVDELDSVFIRNGRSILGRKR